MKTTLFLSATLLSAFVVGQGPKGLGGPPKGRGSTVPPGPACVVGAERTKNSPLPPCFKGYTCQKVDTGCFDLNPKAGGGCLGTCVEDRKAMPFPKSSPPPQAGQSAGGQPWWATGNNKPSGGSPQVWGGSPPSSSGSGSPAPVWGGSSSSPSGGTGGSAPAWGGSSPPPSPGAPAPAWGGSSSAPAASQPWAASSPQKQPPPPSPPQSPTGFQSFGTCPPNIRCPNNDVCTPDPRKKDTFLCITGKDACGDSRTPTCSGGRMCVADPRNSRSGICV